jgi:hypothetical protein
MKVFDEVTVKENEAFFIAGRGGETNMHRGNFLVRQIVTRRGELYRTLDSKARGLKFAKKVLEEDLKGFHFVVGYSYFWRNHKNGKIATAKLKSVACEHGGLQFLEDSPSGKYLNIGETWTLNIIGAILRNVSAPVMVHSPIAPSRHNTRGTCRQGTGKNTTKQLKPREELQRDPTASIHTPVTSQHCHPKTVAPSLVLASQSISTRRLPTLIWGANVTHDLMSNQPCGSSASNTTLESVFEASRRVSLDVCDREENLTGGDLFGHPSLIEPILHDWEETADPVLRFDFSESLAI